MKFEQLPVTAYAGYKANERPVSFEYRGRHCSVVEIIDRWYEGYRGPAALDYFKVKADDGRLYLLRYNSLFDVWTIRVEP